MSMRKKELNVEVSCDPARGAIDGWPTALGPAFDRVYRTVLENASAALRLEIEGETYVRNFRPNERLLILGGGHIACPLCTIAAALEFAVTVVDDRPDFANRTRFPEAVQVLCDSFPDAIQRFGIGTGDYAAVITRGHRYDADCLRSILSGTMPKYLGMIGSRRRTMGLLRLLEEEGFERSLLDQIHTPIGLPIGALTPQEIAVSIAGELVQCRRLETARHSKSRILTCEEIHLELLKLLADPETGKALLLVYETSGSTPAKSGALMAVDRQFRTVGTIGGGCSESAVLREARRMIGTGGQKSVTIDLSNDVAGDEGMVCGGQMKVWIADVTG